MTQAMLDRYAMPRVNILENNEAVMIEAELPGIVKGAAEVELRDGHLFLRADRSATDRDSTVKLRERPDAGYYRVFKLSDDIDKDHVEATMEDGVLTLVLPKIETSARGRRIDISET